MTQSVSQLKKLAIKFRNLLFWITNYQMYPGIGFRELHRIRTQTPYTAGTGRFMNKSFQYTDGLGFLGNIKELFKEECYFFETNNKNPFIIDCGAYIGLSIYYFKYRFPGAKILAFEADPSTFAVLNQNLTDHQLSNVEVHNRAVWNEETELVFYSGNSMSGSVMVDAGNKGTPIHVKTARLKNYLTQPVDFLKLDIEGAEVQVLRDIRDDLGQVERIFFEYHSVAHQPQALGELLEILTAAGFRYYIQEAKNYAKRPFTGLAQEGFDLQLNIFAMR
jgi:FkbM family methyltransferase